MTEWRLKINKRSTGLVLKPDDNYPQLWRIHHKGKISDMVNLSRAKDAAISWVRPRGLGGTEIANWDRRETGAEAPPVRPSVEGVSEGPGRSAPTLPEPI